MTTTTTISRPPFLRIVLLLIVEIHHHHNSIREVERRVSSITPPSFQLSRTIISSRALSPMHTSLVRRPDPLLSSLTVTHARTTTGDCGNGGDGSTTTAWRWVLYKYSSHSTYCVRTREREFERGETQKWFVLWSKQPPPPRKSRTTSKQLQNGTYLPPSQKHTHTHTHT